MTYTIYHEPTGNTYTLSNEDLQTLAKILPFGSEDLADLLTGLNCDSYADMTEEFVDEVAELYDDTNVATDKFINSDDERATTTYAYFRILNYDNSDEVCENYWRDDILGMITERHECR